MDAAAPGRRRRRVPGTKKPSAGLRHWRGERRTFASCARSPTRRDRVAPDPVADSWCPTPDRSGRTVLRQPFKTTPRPRNCHPCGAGSLVCACSPASGESSSSAASSGPARSSCLSMAGSEISHRRVSRWRELLERDRLDVGHERSVLVRGHDDLSRARSGAARATSNLHPARPQQSHRHRRCRALAVVLTPFGDPVPGRGAWPRHPAGA